MWIFSTYGFYSIVVTPKREGRSSGMLSVRARVYQDLVNLLPLLGDSRREIAETPERDYPYRLYVSRKEAAKLMGVLTGGIEYENFKSAVGRQQRYRAEIYHRVWELLLDAFNRVKEK